MEKKNTLVCSKAANLANRGHMDNPGPPFPAHQRVMRSGRRRGKGRAGSPDDRNSINYKDTHNGERQANRSKNRKQTANHLLNFQYERREQGSNNVYIPPNRPRAPSITHEQFLQANFKFVVNPYTSVQQGGFYDPDVLIDWDDIEYVCVPVDAENPYRCPVCLDSPSIPKMTRCGHTFCCTCILRHLEGEISRSCPMCMKDVFREDLRSIRFNEANPPVVNRFHTFELIRCSRGSIVPCLANQSDSTVSVPAEVACELCPTDHSSSAPFCRVVSATPESVIEFICLEQAELMSRRQQCIQGGDTEWLPQIAEAMHHLEEKRQRWLVTVANERHRTKSNASRERTQKQSNQTVVPALDSELDFGHASTTSHTVVPTGSAWDYEISPEDGDIVIADQSEGMLFDLEEYASEEDKTSLAGSLGRGDTPATPTQESNRLTNMIEEGQLVGSMESDSHLAAVSSSLKSDSSDWSGDVRCADSLKAKSVREAMRNEFVFYQAHDGGLAFLHPLCTKCLLADNGDDTTHLPQTLTAKVLDVEKVRVGKSTRQRLPFLRHLPQHCEVLLVEVDVRKLVSKDTQARFKAELKIRAKKRSTQRRDVQREAQVDEDARQAILLQHEEMRLKYEQIKKREIDSIEDLLHGPRLGREADSDSDLTHDFRVKAQDDGAIVPSPPHQAWSFARITQMGGHFPTLEENTGTLRPHEDDKIVASPPVSSIHTHATVGGAWAQGRPGRSSPVPQAHPHPLPASSPLLHVNTYTSPAVTTPNFEPASDSSPRDPPAPTAKGSGGERKKKSKGKGTPLFSNASMRSYK